MRFTRVAGTPSEPYWNYDDAFNFYMNEIADWAKTKQAEISNPILTRNEDDVFSESNDYEEDDDIPF